MKTSYPTPGDRVTVSELKGYRLVQNRPAECHLVCVCGECNGKTIEHSGIAGKTRFYADNSIETPVACDDGRERRIRHEAPHGDPC